ncbi:YheC/YheD family protein [Alteribacter aurantiacus]|uniref:YheC/YheD family protein n=1 Tax=Alteribacter aurantiacus TaxID=254410 RepID=UPI0003FEBA0F|nr:YheC/YheD family protein [Alteribacter aurantiacus]
MGKKTDKLTKYELLKQHPQLAPYLPHTQVLNYKSYRRLLKSYSIVVIKPTKGRRGNGVLKVSSLPEGGYEIHVGQSTTVKEGLRQSYDYLVDHVLKDKKVYIVQQYIHLQKINGSPFDVRVMVQRKKKSSKWVVTGIAVKVAAKKYFITNVASDVLSLEDAYVKLNVSTKNRLLIQHLMSQISLTTASYLRPHYPKRRRLGLDIGIDEKGNLWIIEVNTRGTILMFQYLRDHEVISRIKEYKDG